MRFSCFLIVGLMSSSAFALDFPEPASPVAQALIAQYKQDKPMLDAPNFLAIPSPLPAWPCNLPETEQYKMAGLQAAHPELKAEFEKGMRKAFRETGMGAGMIPKSTYSNIQIIPVKMQCASGKPDGELELLVSYDKRDESTLTIPMGAEMVKGNTVTNMHLVMRSRANMKTGERAGGHSSFMQTTMQMETHYDNAQMEEMTKKNNQTLGLNKPTTTKVATLTAPDGTVATFMEMEDKQVSGGLFGVNVKTVPSLMTTFTLPVDAHRVKSETYKDKQLLTTSSMKDNKQHGEQVIYMDNYLKKLNLRLDQQPGMENAREVTINGVNLIEMRNCYQNGAMVKMSPCPSE